VRLFGGNIAFTDLSTDTFTFVNNVPVSTDLAILGDYSIIDPATRVNFANLPNPQEFEDYTQLVNDKQMSPKKLKMIRMLCDIQVFNIPLSWQSRDSNGEVVVINDFPISQLSPMQYQSGVVDIIYDYMIVGLNQFFFFTMPPFSSVTMTFVYDDFALEDLLYMKSTNIYEKREIEKIEYLL